MRAVNMNLPAIRDGNSGILEVIFLFPAINPFLSSLSFSLFIPFSPPLFLSLSVPLCLYPSFLSNDALHVRHDQ